MPVGYFQSYTVGKWSYFLDVSGAAYESLKRVHRPVYSHWSSCSILLHSDAEMCIVGGVKGLRSQMWKIRFKAAKSAEIDGVREHRPRKWRHDAGQMVHAGWLVEMRWLWQRRKARHWSPTLQAVRKHMRCWFEFLQCGVWPCKGQYERDGFVSWQWPCTSVEDKSTQSGLVQFLAHVNHKLLMGNELSTV